MTAVTLVCCNCGHSFDREENDHTRKVRDGAKATYCSHQCYLDSQAVAPWTGEEIEFLKANYKTMSRGDLAKALGRKTQPVKIKLMNLRLVKNRQWTQFDLEYIRENYGKMPVARIAQNFNCSVGMIRKHARKFVPADKKNPRKWTQENEDDFLSLYRQGFRDVGVAMRLGVCHVTIKRWRDRLGLRPNEWNANARAEFSAICKADRGRLEAMRKARAVLADLRQSPASKQSPVKREPPKYVVNPEDHDRLVCKIALQYGADRRAVKDSWQYADGWIGLLRACELFDPSKGCQFSTYATTWIKAGIGRHFQDQKAQKRGGGTVATFQFSQLADDEHDRTQELAHVCDDKIDLDDEEKQTVKLLGRLDPRTRRFVKAVVMQGKTLREVGENESPPIGKERVRQIVEAGLEELRDIAPVAFAEVA